MDRLLTTRWGTDVVRGRYAGHDGLLYDPAPISLPELLDDTGRWAGRDFLVQGARRITHGAFRRAVGPAATALRERGVGRGDRVLIWSYNRPEFALATWALWWLGAVPVYANRWWGAGDLAHALTTVGPVLVLTDDPGLDTGSVPTFDLAALARVWEATPVDMTAVSARPDDPALMLFTSGSSGAPKAVVLSQRSVIANQHNLLLRSRRLPHQLDAEARQAVSLVCTPLFHIGGISNILTSQLTGARLVLTEGRFDPEEVLRLIATERVQLWGGVPTMAARVLEHPRFADYDLSSLRSFPLGGAPLPPELLARMTRKLPQLRERGLANTWGMTESGGFVTVAGNADLAARPGTVGRPYPVAELRIADTDADGIGEILVRSPTVMLGYLASTDTGVDADGWLHTGDLGHLDDDGYLFLDGRAKDIVIRGGENVSAAHVEAAVCEHPQVLEAAVFGVPHPDLGEQVVAAVSLRPGAAVRAADLRDHCATRLAYFERPAEWLLLDEPLPTLAGEKVDKKAIRERYLTARGQG